MLPGPLAARAPRVPAAAGSAAAAPGAAAALSTTRTPLPADSPATHPHPAGWLRAATSPAPQSRERATWARQPAATARAPTAAARACRGPPIAGRGHEPNLQTPPPSPPRSQLQGRVPERGREQLRRPLRGKVLAGGGDRGAADRVRRRRQVTPSREGHGRCALAGAPAGSAAGVGAGSAPMARSVRTPPRGAALRRRRTLAHAPVCKKSQAPPSERMRPMGCGCKPLHGHAPGLR